MRKRTIWFIRKGLGCIRVANQEVKTEIPDYIFLDIGRSFLCFTGTPGKHQFSGRSRPCSLRIRSEWVSERS